MNQELKAKIEEILFNIKLVENRKNMTGEFYNKVEIDNLLPELADQFLFLFESYQAEKYKKIEEAVEFFDPKNKAIPYVKLAQVLSILTKNDNV